MEMFEQGIPVTEFKWPSWNDIGPLFVMTCKDHTDLRWSTKHPTHRNLHYLGLRHDVEITRENAHYMGKECPCPWESLIVIGKEK